MNVAGHRILDNSSVGTVSIAGRAMRRLGFGAMRVSSARNAAGVRDRKTARAMVRRVVERGITSSTPPTNTVGAFAISSVRARSSTSGFPTWTPPSSRSRARYAPSSLSRTSTTRPSGEATMCSPCANATATRFFPGSRPLPPPRRARKRVWLSGSICKPRTTRPAQHWPKFRALMGGHATGGLAWVLQRSPVMLPIPGTSKVHRLETKTSTPPGCGSVKRRSPP